jgi:hypothetical protein
VLEAAPAVIFGIITWFYLTDRPAQGAGWMRESRLGWQERWRKSDGRSRGAAPSRFSKR